MERFLATLTFILALKKLLGSSLGAANGSLRVHNHSTDFMDRNFGTVDDLLEALLIAFGVLGDLLEALLVASRCPADLQSLKI